MHAPSLQDVGQWRELYGVWYTQGSVCLIRSINSDKRDTCLHEGTFLACFITPRSARHCRLGDHQGMVHLLNTNHSLDLRVYWTCALHRVAAPQDSSALFQPCFHVKPSHTRAQGYRVSSHVSWCHYRCSSQAPVLQPKCCYGHCCSLQTVNPSYRQKAVTPSTRLVSSMHCCPFGQLLFQLLSQRTAGQR